MASIVPMPLYARPTASSLDFQIRPAFPKKGSLVSQASSLSLKYPFLKLYFCTTFTEKMLIWVSFICAVLNGALSPAFALIAGAVAISFTHENINEGKALGIVLRNSLLFGLAGISALFTNFIGIGIIKYVSQKIVLRLQKAYYGALMKQDIEWFNYQDSQELGRKGEMDCKIISDGTEEKLIQVISGFASFIGGVIVSLTRGWKLTLILLLVVPFMIVSALGFAYFVRKAVQSNLNGYAEAGTIAEHAFHTLGTLVSLSAEDKECARYNAALERNKGKTAKLGFYQGICIGFFHVALYVFHVLCFIIGFVMIDNEVPSTNGQPYDPSVVITIFFAIFRGGFSLAILGPGIKAVVEAKRASERIFAILERKSKIEGNSSDIVLSNFQGKISFKNVVFGHFTSNDSINKIIKGISLEIEPGQRVVLLGQSGCGKSTLLRLLLRIYDIHEGSLEIDGVDIRTIDLDCLRTNISFLTQECALFTGTVRENLEMGREDATEEEMIEALKKAHAYDFIMKLEKGLDTLLGAGGVSLSGGQRQRLAIARTLLRNGKIILLDEATASLDMESEGELVKLFESMKNEGKTLVMATHIVNIAKNADMIIFLDDGQVVEMGDHDNLLERKGAYYHLWEAQNNTKADLSPSILDIEEQKKRLSNELSDEIKEADTYESDHKNQTHISPGESPLKNRSHVFKNIEIKDFKNEEEKKNLIEEKKQKKEKAKSLVLGEEKLLSEEDLLENSLAKKIEQEEIISPHPKVTFTVELPSPTRIRPRKVHSENFSSLQKIAEFRKRSRTITEVIRRESRQWVSPIINNKTEDQETRNLVAGFFRLFRLNKSLKKFFYINVLVSAINGALTPLFGFMIGNIAYDSLDAENLDTLPIVRKFGPYILSIMIATFILYTSQFTSWTILAQNLNNSLRAKLFNKMLRMHIGWHENINHGPSALCTVLSTETVNVSKVVNFVVGLLAQSISSVITASIIGSILCWQITMLSLIIVPIILFIVFIQMKLGAKMVLKTEEKKLASHILTEMVQNIITVTTLNENSLKKRYVQVFKKIHTRSTLIGAAQGFLTGFNQCAIFFYFAGMFYFGVYLTSAEISDGREVFAVLFTVVFGAFNVFATLQLSPDIRNGLFSLKNIFEYLFMESEIDIDNTQQTYDKPIKGDIEFRNVTFNYPGKRNDLQGIKNLNFKIQAGKKVALVGPNGSGKSTIFKLLLRYYDVTEGEILVDGVNIREFNLRHLRRGLGLVEQIPRLFYGTIEYNIKCGTENATDEQMVEAVKAANAYEFIEKNEFKNRRGSIEKTNYGVGFQRQVGAEDMRLSKGQRQRISIARAIISKPKILLLDEATTALDSHSEALIDESLNKVMENLTSVIITHRPMTLKKVDQVLYFSNNGIILKDNSTNFY